MRFVLFVLISLAIIISAYQSDKQKVQYEFNKHLFYLHKSQTKEKFDLVIAGDSRSLYGLDAEILKAKLQKEKGINLSFPSNSYTPDYLDFINQRANDAAIIFLPITFESMTSFEQDLFLKKSQNQANNPVALALYWLKLVWPDFKWLEERFNDKKVQTHKEETFSQNGDINLNDPIANEFKMLTNHYSHITKNLKIENQYIESIIKLIKQREKSQFVIFHLCFFEEICKIESSLVSPIIEKFSSLQNVKVIQPLRNYQTTDGDHLTESEQIRFSNDLLDLIKN